MAIKQLTDEQIREWTLEQKDRWWLENVYRGDMRQLTIRSAITGALLGSVLSLTNLYIGIQTGWTLGVGITSVILSFATFKVLSSLKVGDEMTVLENNAMQSIATSAGYMTSPLMASLPAYMMVTGKVIPMWHAYWWMVVLGLLGALFAFPLKKRYINDEQLPFPEGYAAGVVLDNLHESGGAEGVLKAKLLGVGALAAAFIEFLRTETILAKMGIKFLALPAHWDDIIYKFATPQIAGIPMKDLTIQMDSSIVMMGTGMLMSIRSTLSMLLGGIVCYFILAPMMINQGVIVGTGFKNITMWALWGGAAMMTTASLFSFLMSGNTISSILELFKTKKNKKAKQKDVLEHIELPKMVSYIGVPLLSVVIVLMGHAWFDIDYWLAAFAVPFVFVLSIMAVKSTGLTAITPGGALGKITQVTYSVLAPGNMGTNLISAGITSEVSLSASNLLMDIKPAYMLGGKPRHQAIGHAIGIFCGGLVAVPVFYTMFGGDISVFSTDKFPMPGATVWKAVADVLANGLGSLHPTSQMAVAVGGLLGIVFEYAGMKTKGRFPISPVAFGIAFVLPFHTSLEFFVGSLIFWLLAKKHEDKRSWLYQKITENKETIGAGIIAGGSLVGIALLIAETSM
ncbi:MAG: OPT/YSL family transporter [Bdellovibrionales bacterium]|nr:OPT/YSL family transporter [Bdellovibrionales bacterium]